MDQLMQKLMISKAIMDKTDGITRGDSRSMNTPSISSNGSTNKLYASRKY